METETTLEQQPSSNNVISDLEFALDDFRKSLLANDVVKMKQVLEIHASLFSTDDRILEILSIINSIEAFKLIFEYKIVHANSTLMTAPGSDIRQPLLYFLITISDYKTDMLHLIQFLLENGADPSIQVPARGKNVFLCYLNESNRQTDIVEKMLEGRPDLKGNTALHILSRLPDNETNISLIKLLIKLGINIEEKNFEGQTALADSIIFNRIETIKLLLSLGANPKTKDKYGFSCIAKAQLKGENIKQLLVPPSVS